MQISTARVRAVYAADRCEALRMHLIAGKIDDCGVDGLLQALERGLEWGDHLTLHAMAVALQVEFRVIRTRRNVLSRTAINPSDPDSAKHPYVFLHFDEEREHYSALKPSPEARAGSEGGESTAVDAVVASSHTPPGAIQHARLLIARVESN